MSTGAEPLAARAVALELLVDVIRRKRPLDTALESHGRLGALEARDRAFARLIVATCLRRLGQIDALIDALLTSPLPARAASVRDVLRLGMTQLLFLGTAAHAGVHSSVELVDHAGFEGHKGLVNAVLRRVTREGAERIVAQDAARLNTPDWLWDSWQASYGEAVARAVAAAHLAEPPLDLTVKDDAPGWADRLNGALLPTGTIRLRQAGPVGELAGYAEGAWWVQDAAAALPARLLGEVAGRAVIDLCAAPGGKTLQLAAAGARVTAVDRTDKRLARVRANLARTALTAQLVAADAAVWRPSEPADAVLLDAPCSATGTIRRHPDIPWLKSPDDVVKLASVQDRLLLAAIEMVKPGGIILFSTCSLEAEEGPKRIGALLAAGAPVVVEPVSVPGLPEAVTPEGYLRTLPNHQAELGGLDGFFAARLRRAG